MTDVKTTISGLVAAVGAVVKLLGLDIPPAISDVMIAVGVLLMGYFAKDAK